jgi:hypothetical protein
VSGGGVYHAIAHAVLDAMPLEHLQDTLAKLNRTRRPYFPFSLNGRRLMVTRAKAKMLVEEYIDKKTAAGRPPAPPLQRKP